MHPVASEVAVELTEFGHELSTLRRDPKSADSFGWGNAHGPLYEPVTMESIHMTPQPSIRDVDATREVGQARIPSRIARLEDVERDPQIGAACP